MSYITAAQISLLCKRKNVIEQEEEELQRESARVVESEAHLIKHARLWIILTRDFWMYNNCHNLFHLTVQELYSTNFDVMQDTAAEG